MENQTTLHLTRETLTDVTSIEGFVTTLVHTNDDDVPEYSMQVVATHIAIGDGPLQKFTTEFYFEDRNSNGLWFRVSQPEQFPGVRKRNRVRLQVDGLGYFGEHAGKDNTGEPIFRPATDDYYVGLTEQPTYGVLAQSKYRNADGKVSAPVLRKQFISKPMTSVPAIAADEEVVTTKELATAWSAALSTAA